MRSLQNLIQTVGDKVLGRAESLNPESWRFRAEPNRLPTRTRRDYWDGVWSIIRIQYITAYSSNELAHHFSPSLTTFAGIWITCVSPHSRHEHRFVLLHQLEFDQDDRFYLTFGAS